MKNASKYLVVCAALFLMIGVLAGGACKSQESETRLASLDELYSLCWRVTIDKAPEGFTVMCWVDAGGITSETKRIESTNFNVAVEQALRWARETKGR